MGHSMLGNSYNILPNPKSLFNMKDYTHIIWDPSIEAYFRELISYTEEFLGLELRDFNQSEFEDDEVGICNILLRDTSDDSEVKEGTLDAIKSKWSGIEEVNDVATTKFFRQGPYIIIFSFSTY